MADAVWRVGKGGQQLGPFTAEDLTARLASGEVAPSDLVWKEGMAEWVPASSVPELQPPPPELAAAAPEAAGEAPWFIGRGGQQLGPYSPDDIRAMAGRGEINRGDLLWQQGMAEWLPVTSLPQFAGSLKAMPPGLPAAGPAMPAVPGAAGEMFSDLVGDLKAILADPEAGLAAAADKKALPCYLVWVGLFALVMGLLGLQMAASIPFVPGGEVVKAFFKSLLSGAVVQAVLFGAVFLAIGPILKSQADWLDAVAIVALASIPLVFVGGVIFVFAWLTVYAHGLWAGGLPMFVLFLYELLVHTAKATRKFALYAVPAICLATAIVLGILFRLFAF